MGRPQEPSKVWAVVRKYVLAPIPVLVIVIIAVVLVALGVKDLQIGGLIGKLTGKKASKKAVDVANTIPEDRVDADGNLIPIGEPDSRGITQARVVPLKEPGLFDDPKRVKIVDPDGGTDIEVDLPDGVKAKDVDKVVVVSPEVTAVSVKSSSTVSAEEVDDLLAKYGSN